MYRRATIPSRDNTLKSLTITGLNGASAAGGATTEILTPTIPRLVDSNAATIKVRVRFATTHVKIRERQAIPQRQLIQKMP